MDASGCSGCRERDARIADLERRLAELEARLKTNATNSSPPPSANPLGADKPVKKKKSKRKRGGQPNHPPHLKQRLPPECVTRTKHFMPEQCIDCHAPLPREAGPDDPEPKRFEGGNPADGPRHVGVDSHFSGYRGWRTAIRARSAARTPSRHPADEYGRLWGGRFPP